VREPTERELVEAKFIAGHMQNFLRERGYNATVTVEYEGEGRFFASSPTKVPLELWQAAVDDLHYSSAIPMGWLVSSDGGGAP
jgi:hypothetical protein